MILQKSLLIYFAQEKDTNVLDGVIHRFALVHRHKVNDAMHWRRNKRHIYIYDIIYFTFSHLADALSKATYK